MTTEPTAEPGRDQDTEERILTAAHAVFIRRGTHGARMQEIADEAGVNKALLHYYFRSKDRLAEEVFRRTYSVAIPRVVQTLASELPIEEKVRGVARLYLEVLGRNPFLPGYLICEMHQHPERVRDLAARMQPIPLTEVTAHVLGPLRRQLEEQGRAGTIRPIAAEQFVVHLFALCIFPFAARPMLTLVLGLDAVRYDAMLAEREREVVEFMMRGLRP
jgi:AcrR family transcriptional regulator